MKRTRMVLWAVMLAAAAFLWLLLDGRRETPSHPDAVHADLSAPDLSAPRRPMPEPAKAAAARIPAVKPVAGVPDAPTTADAIPRGAIPLEYVASFFSDRDLQRFVALARERGFEVLDIIRFGNSVRLRAPNREAWRTLLADGPAPTDWGHNFHVRRPHPVETPSETPPDARLPDGVYVGFQRGALSWLGVSDRPDDWGAGIRVAVLDSGIGSHPALASATLIHAPSFDANVDPAANPHGTAVASLIAGDSTALGGLAPSAVLRDYAIIGADGSGDLFSLCRAIVDAVDAGCRVINVSLGSSGSNHLLESAVAYATARGALIVAAAGNDGVSGLAYPAALNGVVAVGAVDATGRHLYFSNRGEGVDITAPGLLVPAAGGDGSDALFSGTSAATPLVSGAVAALLSQYPSLSAAEAFAVLTAYADDRGTPGPDAEYGSGILNMGRVEERNTPGIFDVGVGDPYLVPAGGNAYDLVIWVQNRGTEPLRSVTLHVAIDGVQTTAGLFNIPVGGTATRRYAVNTASLSANGMIQVICRATIDGQTDRNPADNNLSIKIETPRL